MLAVLQRLAELEGRIAAGRDQRAHLHRACALDGAVGRLAVRSAEQDRGIEPMGNGAERRQFPIAEVARKKDRGLAVIAQRVEQHLGARAELDTARFLRMIGVIVPDVVKMGELGADAAEIVPDTGKNLLDLFRRFFGEGGLQILAADAVLAQAPADEQRSASEEIRGLVRVKQPRDAQKRDRDAADRSLADGLDRITQARLEAKKEQAIHRRATAGTLKPVPASGSAMRSARRNQTSWK